MAKLNLTDRFVQSRKAAPSGRRDEYADAIVPGLALRVTSTGHKSFVLVARYPTAPKNPTRRSLGDQGKITLEQARQKARAWLELIGRGIDPKVQDARERAAQQRAQSNTFSSVVAAYLSEYAKHLRKSAEAKAILERGFGKLWGARPITDITPLEIANAIKAISDRGATYQAHNAFAWVRGLYTWAIGTQRYGIHVSPVASIKPAKLIGVRQARDRVLSDTELRLVWKATDRIGYPYGPLFRLLILTGQREREVSEMIWAEVNFDQKLWTVPAERMKGGRAHEVPLAPEALSILKGLWKKRIEAQWKNGDFVFTTTESEKPVNGFSKAKARLGKCIETIRAEDQPGEKLQPFVPWVLHDLRRTARTHLSALPVQDMVRELVIAHAKKGLHAVYDQHTYRDEKRECLGLYEKRLQGILKPPAKGVADLGIARAKKPATA